MGQLEPFLKRLKEPAVLDIAGYSVNKLPIYRLKIGNGTKRILMWSQMHGNESTTTKAVADLIKFLTEENAQTKTVLNNCSLCILPMLNPDGALAYTRANANGTDLNRDAQNLQEPESRVLRQVFNEFKPHFCFNLHDQRTIFSAGKKRMPATISLLAPSQDVQRSITLSRKRSMEVIGVINSVMQSFIPGQIGRFDDSFNINCTGDYFQSCNVPTILVEAGHYPNDYQRERTREYVFYALFTALQFIASIEVTGAAYSPYFNIPENEKVFYDIIVRNLNGKDVGIQYKEILTEGQVLFVPQTENVGDLSKFYGHIDLQYKNWDAHGFVSSETTKDSITKILNTVKKA